ncbi:beta-N-acetylhexosaminidase [Gammaproteobacteria bacterium]|nr:beta-N-acetylhexosaminidase [Gammaproteobacteria bacterium]
MIDIQGTSLSYADIELINNNQVGGLILFERNFHSKEQIFDLCSEIKGIKRNILISVDQEGGRVQRFKSGFTKLPSMQVLSDYAASNSNINIFKEVGWLMAAELIAVGIDISFAPVLDVDRNTSSIIGNRSFSDIPSNVSSIAKEFISGMNEAGMQATGKHFPGHGGIFEDSHLLQPQDKRTLDELIKRDLIPFMDLKDDIGGIMCAHILFPEVDALSAGFSPFWIKEILRNRIGFKGVVFSDDLTMKGAGEYSYAERVNLSLSAGCDMVLICNSRDGVTEAITHMEQNNIGGSNVIPSMLSHSKILWEDLNNSDRRSKIREDLANIERS